MSEQLSPSFADAIKCAVVHALTPMILEQRLGWLTGYGRRFLVVETDQRQPREVHAMVHLEKGHLGIHVLWHGDVVNGFGAQECVEDVLESYRIAAAAISEFALKVTVREV
jgi:hypothetical protein